MRILVMSDSHGDIYAAKAAVMSQSGAEVIIHCGDGADEADEIRRSFRDKHVISVRGNNDYGKAANKSELITLEGKKIFVTHGHLYGVKSGLYTVTCAAREAGADVLLFGHTHEALELYDDGLYIMNPGSLRSYPRTYGILEISEKGIITNIVDLR